MVSRKVSNSFVCNLHLNSTQLPFPFQSRSLVKPMTRCFHGKDLNSFARNLYFNYSTSVSVPVALVGRSITLQCLPVDLEIDGWYVLKKIVNNLRKISTIFKRLPSFFNQSQMDIKRKTIVFVTGNPNKVEEFQAILGTDFPHQIVSRNVDLPEYQGKSEDICIEKCRAAMKVLQTPVFIEDTSLCFNAMGGLPGM